MDINISVFSVYMNHIELSQQKPPWISGSMVVRLCPNCSMLSFPITSPLQFSWTTYC